MQSSVPSFSSAHQPEGADALLELLRRDNVVRSAEPSLTPLSGGVSSEIYLVTDGDRRFVVKRALRQLRVKDVWFADPRRNLHEQAYLRYVARFAAEAVPAVLHASERHCYFAMEHLGDGFVNWKQELLAGRCEPAHARRAADLLSTVHARSRGEADLARQFDTTEDFFQLRIDPYLLTTAERHPELSDILKGEARRLAGTREALVHGDYSPKNILIGRGRLVILDCEVAWYGDPAFDVAFLLNHLLLKALHARSAGRPAERFIELAFAAWEAYRAGPADARAVVLVEQRTAPLLLMLMLARVDGKSPVEYLSPPARQLVRDFVYHHLPAPPRRLGPLFSLWFDAIRDHPLT